MLISKPTRWLAYLGGWALFALFFISEDAGRLVYQGRAVPWRAYFVVWLTTAFAWALLAPFAWWLARRIPIERGNWWRGIGFHLLLSLVFALVEEILFAAVTPLFGLPWFPRKFLPTFRAVVPIDLHLNVILYLLIVGIQHGVGYYRKLLEREQVSAQLEVRARQLETQLAQANLNALKTQLHPHFLFNTLHAIVVLVRQRRTDEADQMLTNLSELLRRTLVPSLLLQPLVENAIRHGVSKTNAPVRIELKSNLRDSLLEIQVCDDGPGLSAETSGNGLGLSNTRARLQHLYGEKQSLRLDSPAGGGAIVTLLLPYHPAESTK